MKCVLHTTSYHLDLDEQLQPLQLSRQKLLQSCLIIDILIQLPGGWELQLRSITRQLLISHKDVVLYLSVDVRLPRSSYPLILKIAGLVEIDFLIIGIFDHFFLLD